MKTSTLFIILSLCVPSVISVEGEFFQKDSGLSPYDSLMTKNRNFRKHVGFIKSSPEQSIAIENHRRFFWETHARKIKMFAVGVLIVFLILVTNKVIAINKSISGKDLEIKQYAQTFEKIMDQTNKLVFVTWKDQQDGIIFVENPAFKSTAVKGDLSKGQQVQSDLTKLANEVEKNRKEIGLLKQKELGYSEELRRMKKQLDGAKSRKLDTGASLGFAENVLREYK